MILTAYSDIGSVVEAINGGQVSRYFIKPWREEELADAIRAGIDAFQLVAVTRDLQIRLLQQEQQSTTTYLLGPDPARGRLAGDRHPRQPGVRRRRRQPAGADGRRPIPTCRGSRATGAGADRRPRFGHRSGRPHRAVPPGRGATTLVVAVRLGSVTYCSIAIRRRLAANLVAFETRNWQRQASADVACLIPAGRHGIVSAVERRTNILEKLVWTAALSLLTTAAFAEATLTGDEPVGVERFVHRLAILRCRGDNRSGRWN